MRLQVRVQEFGLDAAGDEEGEGADEEGGGGFDGWGVGLDRLVWIRLDWIGLDWIGLDWIGLDWIKCNVRDVDFVGMLYVCR